MKLHLPCILRSALLAALAALPLSYADTIIRSNEFIRDEYSPFWNQDDSRITVQNGSYLFLDNENIEWRGVSLLVEAGEVDLYAGHLAPSEYQDLNIELENSGRFYLHENGSISNSDSRNNRQIFLKASGLFSMDGGSASFSQAEINKDGILEMHGGSADIGELEIIDSASVSIYGGSLSSSSTTIQADATFQMQGGEASLGELDLNGSLIMNAGQLAGDNITVHSGANFHVNGGSVSFTVLDLYETISLNSGELNGGVIRVNEETSLTLEHATATINSDLLVNGSFDMSTGSVNFSLIEINGSLTMSGGTMSGLDTIDDEGNKIDSANLIVNKGGIFTLSDEDSAAFIRNTNILVMGGFEMTGGDVSYLDLELSHGGHFTMNGGSMIGDSIRVNSGATFHLEESIVEIIEDDDGTTHLIKTPASITGNSIIVDGRFNMVSGNVHFTQLEVSGSFIMNSGVISNNIDTSSSLIIHKGGVFSMSEDTESGEISSITSDSISVAGTFSLEGGQISFSDMEVSGGFTMQKGTLSGLGYAAPAIRVHENGVVDIYGGTIGTHRSGVDVIVEPDGKFYLREADEDTPTRLTTDSITVEGEFIMEGGNIDVLDTAPDTPHISVEHGGAFYLTAGGIATTGNKADISVKGEFDMTGGEIGSTIIRVNDGGHFDMSSGSIGTRGNSEIVVNSDGMFSMSSGEFNHMSNNIYVNESGVFYLSGDAYIYDNNITLTDGGTFEMNGGDIVQEGQIIINGSSSTFNMTAGTVANAGINTSGQFTISGGYVSSGMVIVHDEGIFNLNGGFVGNTPSIVIEKGGIFRQTLGALVYESADSTHITIMDGALYEMQGGLIASSGSAIIDIRKGGLLDMQDGIIAFGADSLGIINIDGKLTMSNGTIADAGEAYINLGSHSEMEMSGGYIANKGKAYIRVGSYSSLTMSGGFIAHKGEAELNVGYTGSFNMQEGSIAENGIAHISIAGDFNMSGGYIAKGDGSAVIALNGGHFDMNAANGAIAYQGSATLEVNSSGIFDLRAGHIAYAEGSQADIIVNPGGVLHMDGGTIAASGTANILVNDGGEFYLNDGDIALFSSGKAHITVSHGGIFYMNGGHIAYSGNADITLEGDGQFIYQGGEIHNKAEIMVMDSAVFDMTNREFAHDITMAGGNLKGVDQFKGEVYIKSAPAFTGNIDLGGLDAARIAQVQTGAGVTLSGLNGTLTLHEGDFLTVGAGNITGNAGSAPIILFDSADGIIALDGLATLGFDAGSMQLVRDENNFATFEIWITNGTINPEDRNKFIYETNLDVWFKEDMTASVQEGKIILSGTLGEAWFASEHVEDDEEAGSKPITSAEFDHDYTKVVVDKDTHLTLEKNVTLNYLEGSSDLTIDGVGMVQLQNTAASSSYKGQITAGEDVLLVKSGSGGFVMAGDLTAQSLMVQEGDFIIARTSSTSIDKVDGRIIVEGSLNLNQGAAEIINRGHVVITGNETHITTLTSIDMAGSATLNLRAAGQDTLAHAGAAIHLTGDAIFRSGTTTTFTVNANSAELWNGSSALMISTDGSIYIERGAGFTLHSLQGALPDNHRDSLKNILVMRGQEIHLVDSLDAATPAAISAGGDTLAVKRDGLFYVYYEDATLTLKGNELILNATLRDQYKESGKSSSKPGLFEQAAIDSELGSSVAQAGGAMLDHANPLADSTMEEITTYLGTMLSEGEITRAAHTMAAVAGSAVTALGAAQRDSMRDQMIRAREHASQPHHALEKSSKLHTWIEASASYTDVSSDNYESGYKMNAWGGSVGAEYTSTHAFTLGLSLTAMYGDLNTKAAETAEGNLDSYYFSLWAHKQSSRWGHTAMFTFATSDASLDRTVNYGGNSYRTTGSTSGQGYGALYELTYDIPQKDDTFLQPLISVSMLNTTMSSYSENGAQGAGLLVGEQEQQVITLAAGARWQKKGGANALGRSAVFELNGRVAYDIGDTRNEVDNALQAAPGYQHTVRGADIGRTALQLGAGFWMPMGKSSQVYVNGNADVRSGSTSWNVNAGISYRF